MAARRAPPANCPAAQSLNLELMQEFLFYFFAILTLVFGLLVVASPSRRNPAASVFFLVLTLVCLAGLFVLLHAFFLAAVQIIVYAGAVMVLFLFVIMFLNVQQESHRPRTGTRMALSVLIAGAIVALLSRALGAASASPAFPQPAVEGGTGPLGTVLFTEYVLPFEVISVLILVAIIGVVCLGKKELK
ncbi:MAG: NADH-quinone oxidoreductase subunit J [Candidatus Omnitrophica bacterium]|nr:NADH-quinone oxidoreductase subunit J [Candidatus Omnitrophota bacterium]